MADMRNRTPFYGAVPTSKLNADHVFMADGSTLQEQADKKFELIETVTLEEDVATIDFEFEKVYSNLIIELMIPNATETTTIQAFLPELTASRIFASAPAAGTNKKAIIYFDLLDCFSRVIAGSFPSNLNNATTIFTLLNSDIPTNIEGVSKIKFTRTGTGDLIFETGTIISVYGREA